MKPTHWSLSVESCFPISPETRQRPGRSACFEKAPLLTSANKEQFITTIETSLMHVLYVCVLYKHGEKVFNRSQWSIQPIISMYIYSITIGRHGSSHRAIQNVLNSIYSLADVQIWEIDIYGCGWLSTPQHYIIVPVVFGSGVTPCVSLWVKPSLLSM